MQNRLVIVASINISDRNAPAVHLLSLAKQLQQRGHQVVLIAPEYDGTLPVSLPDDAFILETTKRLRLPGIPNSLNVLAQLPALWRRRRWGTIYIRSGPMSIVLTGAARVFGYRQVIVEVNGWLADELKVMGYSRLLTSLINRIQFGELALAKTVRVVTEGLKDILVSGSIRKEKITIIGNGTDIEEFRPIDRMDCRNLHKLRKETTYLIFAGNLAEWQDLTTLFKALPLIRKTGIDVELLILGEGREKGRFIQESEQEGIADQVHFLGAHDLATVNEYFNAADIGIAPFRKARNSRIGLSPLKIRDYAAAGLPVVTSNLPGLDTLKDECWITLAEPENAEALATAIIKQHNAPRKKHRQAARTYAEQNFSWADVVQRLERHIWG